MTEEELSHVSELILETIDLRHKNRKLREAIENHKESVGELQYLKHDTELWKALE